MTRVTERLDRAIAQERQAERPCPDLLTFFDNLRTEDDDTIDAELDDLGVD